MPTTDRTALFRAAIDAAVAAVAAQSWTTAESQIVQAELYLVSLELEKGDQSSSIKWRETLEKTRAMILDHKANVQADSERRWIRGRLSHG